MTAYEIPLSAKPQTFSIPLGGVTYKMTLRWNVPAEAWMLDVADASGSAMVGSIPLVTGVDLLGQYAYLGFAGQLVVQTDNDPAAVPTFDNLGTTGHLYFITS
ncbi:conserved hypothetical protein [Burkholderia sp. 8Y]|uniref:phage baseplate plug family protein n=1 Tax=Burkholderia sp. 8Y TaxID=2653133 RepID=UPI0012F3F9BD|nr:hypothetical protein [Burkholderia sp. 8Y]VXB25340.1 conserved hypothetical protein [Burkholderia sp. 8Y]